MAEDIALYHDDLKEVVYVKTSAQVDVLKESGWKRASKEQTEKAQAAAEKAALAAVQGVEG
jgi:hypothetical protein